MYVSWLAIATFASLVPTVWSAGVAGQQTAVEHDELHLQILEPPNRTRGLPAWSQRSALPRKHGVILAVVAAVLAGLFLVLRCYQSTYARSGVTGSANARSLAVGGEDTGECQPEAHPAEELMGLMDISRPAASGLTTEQVKLLEKARQELKAALKKYEDLSMSEAQASLSLSQAQQHLSALEGLSEYAPGIAAARKSVTAAKKALTLVRADLRICSDRLQSFLVSESQRLRALVLTSRAHSANRYLSPTAAVAVAVAERVTSSGPAHSPTLNTSQLAQVRLFAQSIASKMEKLCLYLEKQAVAVPRPDDFQEQVRKASQAVADANIVREQLLLAGAKDLAVTVRDPCHHLTVALFYSTGKSPKELQHEFEKRAATDKEDPKPAEGDPETEKPEGKDETPESMALNSLTASMQTWNEKAEDALVGLKHKPHTHVDVCESALTEAIPLVSEALGTEVHPSVSANAARDFRHVTESSMDLLERLMSGLYPHWKSRITHIEAHVRAQLHNVRSEVAHQPTGEPVGVQSSLMQLMLKCRNILEQVESTVRHLSGFTPFPLPSSPLADDLSGLQTTVEELEEQLVQTGKIIVKGWSTFLLSLRERVESGEATTEDMEAARRDAAAAMQLVEVITKRSKESEDL